MLSRKYIVCLFLGTAALHAAPVGVTFDPGQGTDFLGQQQAYMQRAQNMRIQQQQADQERQRFELEQQARAAKAKAELLRQEAQTAALLWQPGQSESPAKVTRTGLDKIIPPVDQQRLGLTKLSKEELEQLQVYLAGRLLEFYSAGYAAKSDEGPTFTPSKVSAIPVPSEFPVPRPVQNNFPVAIPDYSAHRKLDSPSRAELPTQFELEQASYWTGQTKFAADGTTYYEYRRQTPEGTVFWSNKKPR